MPTYEYECTKCGYKFEKFQNMTECPISKCPKCSKKVRRLLGSGAGIIFKGSGFYATDYRKEPPAADSSKDTAKKDIACPKAKEECNACKRE